MRTLSGLLLLVLVGASPARSQSRAGTDNTAAMLTSIDARATHYGEIARQIWSFAEVGYQETKSSALLQSELGTAGFRMTRGIAGLPTAFTAEFGHGRP
jgi:aminobenzoyl-glutamate utilization protein B